MGKRIGIHQANFIPNFGFFYKMAMCDTFIILTHVDFEKNNFQNRYLLNETDKWVTKSVRSGRCKLGQKQYADGTSLFTLNMYWINAIRLTLNISTPIVFDYPTKLTKTERLIDLIKNNGGDTYITNPSAKDKYLDEELMKEEGINIEYCNVPKHLLRHTFEVFADYGIDGAIRQLPRRKI